MCILRCVNTVPFGHKYHSGIRVEWRIGTELHRSKLPVQNKNTCVWVSLEHGDELCQPYQDSCQSTDLCLTRFGSEIIPYHVHSYCVGHCDLSSFVHLTKAALQPDRVAASDAVAPRKRARRPTYNMATICFIGSLVAMPLSSSSSSAAIAPDAI